MHSRVAIGSLLIHNAHVLCYYSYKIYKHSLPDINTTCACTVFVEAMEESGCAYQLVECLEWIVDNNYKRIVLQFKNEDLRHSVSIVEQLKNAYEKCSDKDSDGDRSSLDLYVTQSNTCCVDLIVTQHISDVDAIVHFGNVCLSKPHIENQEVDKPVLFAFNFLQEDYELLDRQLDEIIDRLTTIHQDNTNRPILVLYDTYLIGHARRLKDKLLGTDLADVANLNCISPCWNATRTNRSMFSDSANEKDLILGQYVLGRPLGDYKSAIYLGDHLSIHLTLHGPSNLWKISFRDQLESEKVNVSRMLNKRMALVQRLKDDDELKVGVIITNPLPNISEMMDRLRAYAKPKNHTLYFISMIQTIDECKIGNFDLCDAFVVINSCTCSTILESLVFNRPILNDLEFKLACGYEGEYGRVLWPGSDTHLSADDLVNRRKVSDVSLALVHMRNDLLERCSRARANMWSGMDYKAPVNPKTLGGSDAEELTIEEGLKGIASNYSSEPLKKPTTSCKNSADSSS